jgi:hypothetical protein
VLIVGAWLYPVVRRRRTTPHPHVTSRIAIELARRPFGAPGLANHANVAQAPNGAGDSTIRPGHRPPDLVCASLRALDHESIPGTPTFQELALATCVARLSCLQLGFGRRGHQIPFASEYLAG